MGSVPDPTSFILEYLYTMLLIVRTQRLQRLLIVARQQRCVIKTHRTQLKIHQPRAANHS